MPGPVTKLMQRGAIPVDRLAERGLRRDRDVIATGRVIGFAAADPEINTAGLNQRLNLRQNIRLHRHIRHAGQPLGQPFALIDIEHGKTLEKRNLPRVAILVLRP
jgi:hypothetical protein